MSLAELEQLYREGLSDNDQGPAHKTVATFAGLTEKKIWLKDGATPMTDGHEIQAPFRDAFFYRIVEHQLAHILFESNPVARRFFMSAFVESTRESLLKNNMPMLTEDEVPALKSLISTVVGLVEDARVESLWGMLYPGSYAQFPAMAKSRIPQKVAENAHRSLETFLIVSAAGIEPRKGNFSKYGPVLKEALKKVERRGFTATLLVSKWLLNQLVTEALPPREKDHQQKQQQAQQISKLAQQLLAKQEGKAEPDEAAEGKGPPAEEKTDTEEPKPGSGMTMADVLARRRALAQVLSTGDNTLSTLTSITTDWSDEKYPPGTREIQQAERMVETAMGLKTSQEEMEIFLGHSEEKMRERVEQLQEALGQNQSADAESWLSLSGVPKPTFRDVRGPSISQLTSGDEAAVSRLRALFHRVMGKKRWSLADTGTTVDVSAYVAAKVAGQSEPCFRLDDPGRGFKVMVLLDRSNSMEGRKTLNAERACRVLSRALRFPFVDFHVWGFQSLNYGLDLTRFDRNTLQFTGRDSPVGGHTPLHFALQVVTRFMQAGDEMKQIFIITDGWPSHESSKGEKVSPLVLKRAVQREVRNARRLGMNVTSIVIGKDGKDLNDQGLHLMFGAPSNWKRMDEQALGTGLVKIVSSSFTKYLRNG